MKIAVHAQVLTEQNLSGIGYYTLNLLKALFKIDHSNHYLLFASKELKHLRRINQDHQLPFWRPFSYTAFPKAVNDYGCTRAFIPKEVVPFGMNIPKVITAYDLYYLKCSKKAFSQIPRSAYFHYVLALKLHFARAERICAISEDTKRDLMEMGGIAEKKIVVTPLGYDPECFYPRCPALIAAVKQKYQLKQPYFINVSSLWWERKNLNRLIEAFARLFQQVRGGCDLVITGKKGPSYGEMQRLIAKLGVEDSVHLVEYVPEKELSCLLQGARALVFPSLHEGFGLPIVEAMATGCPVITSNVSAMPEAAGGAALLIDPLDVGQIEEAMRSILESNALYEQLGCQSLLRAKSCSWDNTARATLRTFY